MPTKKNTQKSAKKVIKKTLKKAASKKSTTKKTQKMRALVCAEGTACFWTTDGSVLEDLEQLETAFGSMEDEIFLHHVTKEKNDFADWVEHVLDDAACAADLRRSKKPSSARTVVKRHLRQYNI